MRVGGIILCGGESRRMGRPKASLPFGDESMLARVVRLLGQAVDPLVTVAAAGQLLPTLPAGVIVARDRRPGRGPLQGLLAGFEALERRADAAFVSSCDAPLLEPAFVSRMISRLGEAAIAVPLVHGRYQPLAAVYHTRCIGPMRRLLATEQLRLAFLFEEMPTVMVRDDELRDIDPALHSLFNVNCPADYNTALQLAGFSSPGARHC